MLRAEEERNAIIEAVTPVLAVHEKYSRPDLEEWASVVAELKRKIPKMKKIMKWEPEGGGDQEHLLRAERKLGQERKWGQEKDQRSYAIPQWPTTSVQEAVEAINKMSIRQRNTNH